MATVKASRTCDSSVLVAAMAGWHPRHDVALDRVHGQVRAVPAHVLIETYSVLTRVPAPRRLTGRTAAEAISRLPQEVLTISPNEHLELVEFLGSAGITGGAVHDALIGFTTKRHDLVLLTLDARAAPTYDRVGAGYEFL